MYIIISDEVFLSDRAYLGWQEPIWDDSGYFWTRHDTIMEMLKSDYLYHTNEHPFLFRYRDEAVQFARKLKLPTRWTITVLDGGLIMTDTEYWIVHKRGEYVSGTDEAGYPVHTQDKNKAWRFYDFNKAMSFFNLGYIVSKKYA